MYTDQSRTVPDSQGGIVPYLHKAKGLARSRVNQDIGWFMGKCRNLASNANSVQSSLLLLRIHATFKLKLDRPLVGHANTLKTKLLSVST